MASRPVQNYVSNELVHFLGRAMPSDAARYELLLHVLRRGWLTHPPHIEEIRLAITLRNSTTMAGDQLIIPDVVCFADIPLNQLEIHMGKYSRFGVAFPKAILVRKRATPVMYVSLDSPVLRYKVDKQRGITMMAGKLPGPHELGDMDSVSRDQIICEAITKQEGLVRRVVTLAERTDLTPELRMLLNEVTELNQFTIGLLYPFLKGFQPDLADDHPDNVYMEREWRVAGNVQFAPDDVSRVIVPGSFADAFRADAPEFADRLYSV